MMRYKIKKDAEIKIVNDFVENIFYSQKNRINSNF